MRRWRELDLLRLAVPTWSALLALVICLPLLSPGYVLSYDMVWVPHLDLHRPEIWGLGSGLPRAVPSDAISALAGAVLPAELVQRLVLFGALFLLSLGTARLLKGRVLIAQLAGATLAVWNPYVAERLVLGQWPLLLALAAFPWLVGALHHEDGPRWSVVVVALAATALTPATGVMGLVLGVVAAWRRGVVPVGLLATLLNGPWIVAGLQHAAIARSDPRAVGLFDLQAEGAFGRLGSAMTLGGIWNTEVVPTSRTLGLAVLIGLAMGAVILAGLVSLWAGDRRLLLVLAVPGSMGLMIALAGWLTPGLVAQIVADVPAGGLVRDGTRWLALLVPLEAAAFGAGVCVGLERAARTSWRWPVMVAALLVPLAALPDLGWGVAGRLEPTSYPASWSAARTAITRDAPPGDILVLPFTAYRRPTWNHDTPVLDPAGRYFDRTTVVNDELLVSGKPISGEDPRAARIGRVLDEGGDVTPGLARQGIGVVVVETDAVEAKAAERLVTEADELEIPGRELRVFTISGARTAHVAEEDRKLMAGVWGIAGLTLLIGFVGLARRGVARLHRKPAEHGPRQVPEP